MFLSAGGGGPAPPIAAPVMIATGTGTAPSNTSTRYGAPVGCSAINQWQSSSSRPDTPVAVAGTISDFVVRLPVALTGGQSWTFNLLVNGAASGLTVTITSSGQVQTDGTHSVHVDAGDELALQSVPSGTPNAQTNIQWGLLFTSDTAAMPMFVTWNAGTTSPGYGAPGSTSSATQESDSRDAILPCGGSVSALHVNLTAAPGAGQSRTVTLMKNGADTGLSVTVSGTDTSGNASVDPVHFAEGDVIKLRQDIAGAAASSLVMAGIDFTPDNDGEVPLLSPGNGSVDGASTHFASLQGCSDNTETTESNVPNVAPVALTLTKFRADVATAPGSGKSRTFTVRKNGADTAASAEIADDETSAAFAGSLAIAAGDLVDWAAVPSGTPASSDPVEASFVVEVA